MFKPVTAIEVRIWGKTVGAVALDPRLNYYAFEYDPAFIKTGIDLAPVAMPVVNARTPFVFTDLPENTYKRLPANCDDHSKNISFILRQEGGWQLAPAYDVTHAYNPKGKWNNQHLMSINGKFSGITTSDMLSVANRFGIGTAPKVLKQVREAIAGWPAHAAHAGIGANQIARIGSHHHIEKYSGSKSF